MQTSDISFGNFGPTAVALMGRACDEAWAALSTTTFIPSAEDACEIRSMMAVRVLEAVSQGEHDLARLKELALQAIEA